MEKSLFVQFVAFFVAIAKDVEARVNGKLTPLTYLYKEMYKEQLSVDLKWNTMSTDGTFVTADVVPMDSPLSLKKRDAVSMEVGDIPKLGMKMYLSEKVMSDIDVLKARNVETAELVKVIFDDTVKCIMGVHEKLEFIGLQILSEGVSVIELENNVGLGVRIDVGYKDANKFGVKTPWSDPAAKPMDDIRRMMRNAKSGGSVPGYMWMGDDTFENFAANTQARQEYAFSQNFSGDNSNIPSPDIEQVNAFLKKKKLPQIIIVDRTVTSERDGVRTVHTPWAANKVVFTTSAQVGKLWYGILAEETRQNKAVTYTKSGSFTLLKKWHANEPFAEFTSSQALVVPIPSNVGSIYILDAEEADLDAQTEGNSTFMYETVNYTKASVATALKKAKPSTKLTVSSTDAKLLDAINELSEEQITIFEANIVAV